MKLPAEIVNMMMQQDHFSQWMGINVLKIETGHCILQMKIKNEMLNGFQIVHGGISFSLADSALAFASNSRGYKCVSIETSISHLKKVQEKDILTAKSIEISRGRKIGKYIVEISNQEGKLIAFFNGTVQISEEIW